VSRSSNQRDYSVNYAHSERGSGRGPGRPPVFGVPVEFRTLEGWSVRKGRRLVAVSLRCRQLEFPFECAGVL